MTLKIGIISEKLGTKEATDTTIIANEAVARGHEIFEIRPNQLSFIEGRLLGNSDKGLVDLAGDIDVIHFRPNPPVDMAYLTNLYLLDRIKDKTLIINNPESIIKFPEKILPLDFYEFMPPTIITSDIAQIQSFCDKHQEIVVKPLYEFGGNGIKKYTLSNINELVLDSPIPVTAQKFLPNIIKGDKRILYIDGEFESAFMRVPKKGEFLANTIWGSTLEKTELTARERALSEALKPLLRSNGIYICGIDVIDGFVTEINITSPAGFRFSNHVYGTNPEKKLWNIIESKF